MQKIEQPTTTEMTLNLLKRYEVHYKKKLKSKQKHLEAISRQYYDSNDIQQDNMDEIKRVNLDVLELEALIKKLKISIETIEEIK